MSDIYKYLTQDLYTIDGGQPGVASAPASVAQAASAGSGETSSESIVSGDVDGNLSFIGGFIQSKNFVTGASGTGWRINADGTAEFQSGNFRGDITGATGTFSGTVTVASLNIPDATTASSMHVDTSGNTWWGSNVATGYTGANAYVLATGAAVFKNIVLGGTTLQYVITNSGIFSYGDGADGYVTISVDTTLTSDKYYNNLTVNSGAVLNPGGYRIFVKDTLTLSGNGKISGNGSAGSPGTAGTDFAGAGSGHGTGGAGGSSLADGYLKGTLAGASGSNGGNAGIDPALNGSNGSNTSNSLGSNGVSGGTGGTRGGGTGTPATGGTGGTITASNVALKVGVQLATLLDIGSTGSTIKYDNSATGGGGGGGVGGSPAALGAGGGGGGGGSGTPGRIIAIYARNIVINSGSSITSNGGVGGVGGQGGASQGDASTDARGAGGGGGGAGGNGGILILVYNSFTNGGSTTVSAGAGGTGGVGGTAQGASSGHTNTAGNSGVNGTSGSPGTIYEFQLSL